MNWKWKKFDDLNNHELYEILALRQRVFIIEQKCPYLDADGKDLKSWHLCAWENQNLLAYLRVVPAGEKFDEPSIGRVVTAPEARGRGLGKAIMMEAFKRMQAELGPTPIRISAQSYLEKFYTELGFEKVGEGYLEDWIPHIEMLRS